MDQLARSGTLRETDPDDERLMLVVTFRDFITVSFETGVNAADDIAQQWRVYLNKTSARLNRICECQS